jgi:hypothetical protein
VFALSSLVRLDLSHNELTHLPPAIGALTRLEELWLNDNPLSALPAEIGACGQLAQLLLDHTCIAKLPRELGRLPKLVEVTVEGTPLRPDLRTVYARGGTLGLLAHLRHKDTRRGLKAALREVLTLDVYHEAGLSAEGKAAIDGIVRAVAAEFADFGEFRLLIRNAARLFPPTLAAFDVAEVRARQAALVRDNRRKQLSADCELKLRALYYDRIDVTRVEGVVNGISAAIPTLDDMEFLLQVGGCVGGGGWVVRWWVGGWFGGGGWVGGSDVVGGWVVRRWWVGCCVGGGGWVVALLLMGCCVGGGGWVGASQVVGGVVRCCLWVAAFVWVAALSQVTARSNVRGRPLALHSTQPLLPPPPPPPPTPRLARRSTPRRCSPPAGRT